MKSPTRILSWNARVGRRPSAVVVALLAFIAVSRPQVIVLSEATSYTKTLRRAFGLRWHVYRKGTDMVVMVRRSLPQPEVSTVGHVIAWRGPKAGLPHVGRRWLVLDWDGFRLIAVHRVPGGPAGGVSEALRGANKPAWDAETVLLLQLLFRVRTALVVGDQNAEIRELINFMESNDLHPIKTGAKVDWAMARRYRAKGKRLLRRGSDHPAVLYKRR